VVTLLLAACADESSDLSPGNAAGNPASAGDERPWDQLVAQAEVAYEQEDHERSAALYLQAAAQATAAGDQRRAISLTAQRAVCLKFLGRTDEAREALIPTLASARALGDQRTEGLALGNLARVETLAGNDALALGYLDQLTQLSVAIGDPRLEVQTMEQAAMLALSMGQLQMARVRIDAALVSNLKNVGEDDRRHALMRQKASILVRLRDDEGALAAWAAAPAVGASLANRALLLSELGLHAQSSLVAAEAARLFDEEGPLRHDERDEALYLSLSEALRAGERDDVQRRLDVLLAGDVHARAAAPFRVLQGRLSLSLGASAEAATVLEQARAALGNEPLADLAGLLAAVARGRAGQLSEAHALLDTLSAGPARAVLRGWLMADAAPTNSLALERLPGLDSSSGLAGRSALQSLRRACPLPLPSLAWVSMHHHLSDADRHRAAGRHELADATVRDGARLALRWQLLERQAEVRGDFPSAADTATAFARIDDWVAGRIAADEAVIVVLADAHLSYLLVCTSALGASTFGLPPSADLAGRGSAVAEALASGDELAVALAGRQLHRTLFGRRALEDLAGRTRWALILPESLASVPPALLVSEEPSAGQPVAWMVRTHALRQLPHAPLAGPAQADEQRKDWLRFGEPLVSQDDRTFTLAQLAQHYGGASLISHRLRPGGSPASRRVGAAATASGLRDLVSRSAALELSVPAFGGGRLGGLVLSPDEAATYGDERVGFMPWNRLAQLDLPPLLVLDRCRIDPRDENFGVSHVAACVLAGGARWLVLTRWPMPSSIRESLMGALVAEVTRGIAPDHALAALQRQALQAPSSGGLSVAPHPRQWASLIVVGGN
jgi:hypothetical protein